MYIIIKNIFTFYKHIGFSIERKQEKLKTVLNSYTFYSKKLFNKAIELHKQMGHKKVAEVLKVPRGVVYYWLFKNYQNKILDVEKIK